MQKAGSPLQPLSSGVVHIHAHAHTHLTLPCTTSPPPSSLGKGLGSYLLICFSKA